MSKIRIPATQVPQFKTFCKQFASHFEKTTGVRLRGNNLLNLLARSAGHHSYTALLIDSGTYGDGDLMWDSIPQDLSKTISLTTSISQELCLHALTMSLRDVLQAHIPVNAKTMLNEPGISCIDASGLETSEIEKIIRELHPSIKSSLISFSAIESDISQTSDVVPAEGDPSETTMSSTPGAVMGSVANASAAPASPWEIDSIPLRTLDGKIMPYQPFSTLRSEKTTSIFAPTGYGKSTLASASKEELSTIAANTRLKFPFSEVTITLGERFAKRKRPIELLDMEQQIIAALEIAKTSNPQFQEQKRFLDLNQLSNSVYQLLPTTNGFSSLDVAGWILDHGRKYGVSVTH